MPSRRRTGPRPAKPARGSRWRAGASLSPVAGRRRVGCCRWLLAAGSHRPRHQISLLVSCLPACFLANRAGDLGRSWGRVASTSSLRGRVLGYFLGSPRGRGRLPLPFSGARSSNASGWAFGSNRTVRFGSSVSTKFRFSRNRNRSVLFRDGNRENSVRFFSVRFRFISEVTEVYKVQ